MTIISFQNFLEKVSRYKVFARYNVLVHTVQCTCIKNLRPGGREDKLGLILLFFFVEALFKSFMLATSEN
jgi:hypothetical protein